jgi:hypothetical protein
MPKPDDQNVFWNGIVMSPRSAGAAKIRRASVSEGR